MFLSWIIPKQRKETQSKQTHKKLVTNESKSEVETETESVSETETETKQKLLLVLKLNPDKHFVHNVKRDDDNDADVKQEEEEEDDEGYAEEIKESKQRLQK